ncbi:MAG: hypothetical protein J6N18_11615 [Kiritimatiellae bacterium]|nr:hypothetical protein [Kiritimatiellia bacterium]
MTERPILFNTEMVRAILDGRKTQTRRIIKPQPTNPRWNNIGWVGWDDGHGYQMKAPCNPGDILWVRETWVFDSGDEDYGTGCFMYKADMPIHIDAKDTAHGDDVDITSEDYKWHPSIHMPKEAARIFLRVKDVRVERLQDITVLDAINEGCCGTICDHADANPELGCTDCYNTGWLERPETEFALLWDTTVKKADLPVYGWEANPWVWVIKFERCEPPKE